MSNLGQVRLLAPIVIIGSSLVIAPAQANECTGACKDLIQAKPSKPLRLDRYRKQPVALGKPVRAVKAPGGDYAKVKLTRKPKADREPQLQPPQFLPVVVSPEATDAMAMRDVLSPAVANAMPLVRIVEADEINEIDLVAPLEATDQPLNPVRVATSSEPPARIVTSDEINEIDRDIRAVATAVAARQAAAQAQQPVRAAAASDGFTDWFERLGSWLVGAVTSAMASVRSLFG